MPKKYAHSKGLAADFRKAVKNEDIDSLGWYFNNRALELTQSDNLVEDILDALDLIREVKGTERYHHYENRLLNPAIINQNLPLVEALCRSTGIRPETLNEETGHSALETATLSKNAQAVSLLLNTTYDLTHDPAEIVARSCKLAVENNDTESLYFLIPAYAFQAILKDDAKTLTTLFQSWGINAGFTNKEGNTVLHHAFSYINVATLPLILEHFYSAFNTKNHKGQTPVDLITQFTNDSDSATHYLFSDSYSTTLQFIFNKIRFIDSHGGEKELQNLSNVLLPVLKKLSHPEAEAMKGELLAVCQSPLVQEKLLTSANIKLQFIPAYYSQHETLVSQQSMFITILLNAGNNDHLSQLISMGVNPNFHLENGETPLTYAVKMQRVDWVEILLSAESILPHMPNQFNEVAAYLAFINKDVPCFATIMMNVKTPPCEVRGSKTTPYQIKFPVHGWVDVNLDNTDQTEMWEGLSVANYMDEKYNVVKKTFLTSIIRLKELVTEQLEELQKDYARANRLATAAFSTPFIEEDAYFLTRHRKTSFLDDPDKRGRFECQSAVLTLKGCPIGVFTHEIAAPRGASIAYHVSERNYLTGTKADMNSIRLWQEHAYTEDKKLFEADSIRAIKILDTSVKRPGNALVRHRDGGGYKQRTYPELVSSLQKMAERSARPYYRSEKKLNKHGGEGVLARFKVNENHLYFSKCHSLPYNEVLIKTDAMSASKNPVDDISHIFLAENKGGISILSLIVAVSTQMELILHHESNRYFPICYYDATTGHHAQISVSSLTFLTKLAEICYAMPLDCIRFNSDLGELLLLSSLAPSINYFFSTEYKSADIEILLLQVCAPQYHHNPQLQGILYSGQIRHPIYEEVVYAPYIGVSFNTDVNNANRGFQQCYQRMVEGMVQARCPPPPSFSPIMHAMQMKQAVRHCHEMFWKYKPYHCETLSQKGHIVLKTIPHVALWEKFWEEERAFSYPPMYLWNILSYFIINCPYEDEPDDFEKSGDFFIYRPNHDPSHAIRKFVLIVHILNYLQIHGRAEVKAIIEQITNEERALLILVAFLERCGRTNEESGTDDPSNAIRSMEIIKQITCQLGFNPVLVNSICANAINFEGVYIGAGFVAPFNNPNLAAEKATLFSRILTISHHSDLGRCRDDGIQFVKDILSSPQNGEKMPIVTYLVYKKDAKDMVKYLTDLIVYLSSRTGTKIRDYKDNFDNVDLKAACIYNTHSIIENLLTESPFLSHRFIPSEESRDMNI